MDYLVKRTPDTTILGYARVSRCCTLTAKREMITFTKVPGNRRIFSTQKELLVFYTP